MEGRSKEGTKREDVGTKEGEKAEREGVRKEEGRRDLQRRSRPEPRLLLPPRP